MCLTKRSQEISRTRLRRKNGKAWRGKGKGIECPTKIEEMEEKGIKKEIL